MFIIFQASIIAVIVPEEEELVKFGEKEGLKGDFKELCGQKVSVIGVVIP